MKIDMYAHILPQKFYTALRQKSKKVLEEKPRNPAVLDLDVRLRLMNRFPDVLQVLTLHSLDPLEQIVEPVDAVELASMANDEIADMVVKYPDKFAAGVACLPMNDVDAALKEVDRAITQLGLKGVQIYTRINGELLDTPKFKPLYEKMAKYDLPIWIHPFPYQAVPDCAVFSLVYETSCAIQRLISGGILREYPDIKFIAHHCGAIVPLLEGRLENKELFRKFYCDTATYGSTSQIMCGYAFFGTDHLLFGTDSPMGAIWGHTDEVIKSVERMNITDTEKEKIFLQNALRLLKISI